MLQWSSKKVLVRFFGGLMSDEEIVNAKVY